jgi:Carboxypeptidase regulatory-like domain/TonB dependent receptor
MSCSRVFRALMWLALSAAWGTHLGAQGVTGAAVHGVVFGIDSQPLPGATVQVDNPATGEKWRAETLADGRFYLDHLSVGGPYRILVRAIGYTPESQDSVYLSLGQRLSVDVLLLPAAYQLADVDVTAVPDPRINKGRTGPAITISDSVIERQPVFGRDYTNLALLSPQVAPTQAGLSFAGAHGQLNSVQLDGAAANDLKGTGFSREGGLFALPLEALQEVKILTAPFDVRFGNFAGGLIQAASKSGSNTLEGSLYGHFEGLSLNGTSPDGTRGGQNTRNEAGLTLGGPIVRDKVAAFFSANGLYQLDFPISSPGRDTTGGADSVGVGVRYATMIRFQNILRDIYGVNPGEIATGSVDRSTRSLFAKVTAQLGLNTRLEVSHDYLYQNVEIPFTFCCNAGLTSNAEEDPVHDNTTQLNWTAAFGRRWSNELVLARTTRRHRCIPLGDFPTIQVEADAGTIVAGMQEVCLGQDNGQSILALTDNLGWALGSHRLTLGTHNELIRIYDDHLGVESTTGQWYFHSLDDLEQGTPFGYTRPIAGPDLPASVRPDFRAWQLGWYVQDQWTATRRLTLTGGIRLDVPLLPTQPEHNPDVLRAFGVNTSSTPSGHFLWSPRLGINYDVSGRQSSILRGGIGLFQGPPPFGWLEEAYAGTGLQAFFLECFDEFTPPFTLEQPQPDQCGDGSLPTPVITAFDPAFRYPQNLKIAVGADQRLPWNIVATMDLIYTRGVHQFALRDLNLLPPVGFAAGEGGRALYGTIDESGTATPNLRDRAFDQVAQITNASGDRAYSLSFQLQKRFENGNELGVFYTYTDARNREDSPRGDSFGNLSATVVDGTRENPNLRTSLYEVPHQLRFLAALDLPLDVRLGVFFFGGSGSPFSYTVQGDVNADGFGTDFSRVNDAVYVPANAGDITLVNPEDGSPALAEEYARLNQFIESQPCLRSQRGRLLRRNSCRQPWTSELDARLTKVVSFARGHFLEISADVFNVLNFLDRDWGRKYSISDGGNFFASERLLELRGYDVAGGRGIYAFTPPRLREFDVEGTRWQMRLSAKYTFH